MPFYNYKCLKCEYVFEKLQSVSEKPIKVCPKCKAKVKKIINFHGGFNFIGEGFYENDYKKKV